MSGINIFSGSIKNKNNKKTLLIQLCLTKSKMFHPNINNIQYYFNIIEKINFNEISGQKKLNCSHC